MTFTKISFENVDPASPTSNQTTNEIKHCLSICTEGLQDIFHYKIQLQRNKLAVAFTEQLRQCPRGKCLCGKTKMACIGLDQFFPPKSCMSLGEHDGTRSKHSGSQSNSQQLWWWRLHPCPLHLSVSASLSLPTEAGKCSSVQPWVNVTCLHCQLFFFGRWFYTEVITFQYTLHQR